MSHRSTYDAVLPVTRGPGALLLCAWVLACTSSPEPLNPVDGGCREHTWYRDDDGDGLGHGAGRSACEAPQGYVDRAGDNCPAASNVDQRDTDGDGLGDACDVAPQPCQDLTELDLAHFSARGGTVSALVAPQDHLQGARALRLQATAGDLAVLRFAPGGTLDLRNHEQLRLAVRARNTNTPSWQVGSPVVVLEDSLGRRQFFQPIQNLLGVDGQAWTAVRLPLPSGTGWVDSGDAVDLARIRAVEIGADSWGAGFTLDVDAWMLAGKVDTCETSCPQDCSGQGTCNTATLQCNCRLGATGPACEVCEPGFVSRDGHCEPPDDRKFTEWPNAASRTNGDAWLRVHHDELRVLRPRVLVLDFVNVSTAEHTQQLVSDVMEGFAEASRPRGVGTPQLQYTLAQPIVSLKDGTGGRPAAPAGWPYQNSTLYPRLPNHPPAAWNFDYAALFSAGFAPLLGVTNPDAPGTFLTLCAAVERGLVNEVWMVTSGDVPDAQSAEVLESKQRYLPGGHAVPGAMERCAGNGCFAPEVPACARSIRIGAINYNRGPGCYLHSQGHSVEGAAQVGVVPDLSSWFMGFGGFDLDVRHNMPVRSLYGLSCSDTNGDGTPDPPCLQWLTREKARMFHGSGSFDVNPFDPACGNVHFPPNAGWHYEYDQPTEVLTRCASFGQPQQFRGPITNAAWHDLEAQTPDCGGGYLTWWFRQMPAGGSGHVFPDGSAMKPVWPFLFY